MNKFLSSSRAEHLSNCEGYIRFSYANSLSNIEEALDRLEKFFRNYS